MKVISAERARQEKMRMQLAQQQNQLIEDRVKMDEGRTEVEHEKKRLSTAAEQIKAKSKEIEQTCNVCVICHLETLYF